MSQIADLIQKRQAALVEERKRKEEETEAFFAAAVSCVEEALGDFRDEFVPFWYAENYGGLQRRGAHLPGYMSWRIEHPKYGVFRLWVAVGATSEEGVPLVPVVRADDLHVQVHPVINGSSGRVCLNDESAMADFFSWRAEATQKEKAEALQKKIESLSRPLAVHVSQYDRETVGDMIGELLQLDPDNAEAYRQGYSEWLKRKDEEDIERAKLEAEDAAAKVEAKVQREKQAQAAQAYREALTAWWEAYEQVLQSNRAKLKEMQFRYDVPFRLWELSYSLSGRDEGGEEMFEERSFYVLSSTPRDGMWDVWDTSAERVSRTAVFNAAWLKELGNVKPTGKHGVCVTIKPAGMGRGNSLKVSPLWWNEKAAIQAEIDKEMLPFPPRPSADEFPNLTERDEYNITEEVLN